MDERPQVLWRQAFQLRIDQLLPIIGFFKRTIEQQADLVLVELIKLIPFALDDLIALVIQLSEILITGCLIVFSYYLEDVDLVTEVPPLL